MIRKLAIILSVFVAFGSLVTITGTAGDKPQQPAAESGVTVTQDDASFTLANGVVTAKVNKRSGDLVSLKYKELEMLGSSGHPGGYWSHAASGPRTSAGITIDPKDNKGERGEVAVKAISGGAGLGNGPGGRAVADLEIG